MILEGYSVILEGYSVILEGYSVILEGYSSFQTDNSNCLLILLMHFMSLDIDSGEWSGRAEVLAGSTTNT